VYEVEQARERGIFDADPVPGSERRVHDALDPVQRAAHKRRVRWFDSGRRHSA